MNSRQLIYIILVVLIIAVALYITMYNKPAAAQDLPEYVTTESGDEYLAEEFREPGIVVIDDVSKITKDTECEEMSGEQKDSCYIGRAAINYDETQCELIGSVAFKDDCFLKVAVDGGKADVCENLTSGKSECYSILAQQYRDARLCERIPNSKEICMNAYLRKDSSNCLQADFYTRQCNEAVAFNDSAYCSGIVNFTEDCYLGVAIDTNNAQLCEKLVISQDHCYYQIAINTSNTNICNLLADSRDNCVADIAFNTNNRQLCEQAGSQKISCLEDLS